MSFNNVCSYAISFTVSHSTPPSVFSPHSDVMFVTLLCRVCNDPLKRVWEVPIGAGSWDGNRAGDNSMMSGEQFGVPADSLLLAAPCEM